MPLETDSTAAVVSATHILIVASNLLFALVIPYIAKKCFEKNKINGCDEETKTKRKEVEKVLFGADFVRGTS